MKLVLGQLPAPDSVRQDLDLIICVTETTLPVVYTAENSAYPDRHYLLGVVQRALMALEELDPDVVAFINASPLTLERNDEFIRLSCEITIIKGRAGGFAVLTRTDQGLGRHLLREAARKFTGLIRLDIP